LEKTLGDAGISEQIKKKFKINLTTKSEPPQNHMMQTNTHRLFLETIIIKKNWKSIDFYD
jgi:hypothetical protein